MHCGFETSILFLILWRLYYVHSTSELFPLWFLLLISGCFACFSPQHVAAHNLSAKGEVSFPLVWIGRFVREKKQRIISAVAKGCREVVWHRHWLSLLRSEGIVRLREKKKERKGAKWVSEWTKLQIGLDEMQVSWGCAGFLFIYFISFATYCSGQTSNQSCFPNSRPSGERMDKQITHHQEEVELDHVPHCLLALLSFHSWSLFGGKEKQNPPPPPKSWNQPCLQSHADGFNWRSWDAHGFR